MDFKLEYVDGVTHLDMSGNDNDLHEFRFKVEYGNTKEKFSVAVREDYPAVDREGFFEDYQDTELFTNKELFNRVMDEVDKIMATEIQKELGEEVDFRVLWEDDIIEGKSEKEKKPKKSRRRDNGLSM